MESSWVSFERRTINGDNFNGGMPFNPEHPLAGTAIINIFDTVYNIVATSLILLLVSANNSFGSITCNIMNRKPDCVILPGQSL